ncbi:unnamed protein product [Ostreobium quekettii]|uniref:non-specific serine/threonine protein kinase n=1 Tax=Ostreobium quekettii TaxID=121088 RepID=A0A8S1IML1_9CHLO|nr:unnamed protein product [Ostreobium quekettii]
MVEQIKREIAITKDLKHPNVVDLIEVMASKDKIYMVMELLTGGELFDKIAAEGAMTEHKARKVFQQLVDALEYCHQEGVFHRDLKPENVLLSSDGSVKLSDFGLGAATVTQSMSSDGFLKTTCGTPNYVAPEVLKRRGYHGAPADIWSLGVVLYVTAAGKLPFDDRSLPRLFNKIAMADYEMPPHLTPELQDLLRKLMCPDPQKRITIPEIHNHSWFQRDYVPAMPLELPSPRGSDAEDIFLETVELKRVEVGRQSTEEPYSPPLRRSSSQINAFHLIGTALDLSTLFESRKEVIQSV